MPTRLKNEKEFHDRVFQNGTRARVTEYYVVVRASRAFYEEYLSQHSPGKTVLEYGCGPGSAAFFLAERGATVTGIDISEVAIRQAKEQGDRISSPGVTFRTMDAEALEFADDSFDIVCGTGILHHLDVERAFSEIARVLRPAGSAVFIEPLGHNPLINRFRKSTPHLRTRDEHPLLIKDVRCAERFFKCVRFRPYGLLTQATIPFRTVPGFRAMLTILEALDAGLFKVLPVTRKLAWQAVIVLEGPRKAASD
jgi:SAM-dependent methyltransferase